MDNLDGTLSIFGTLVEHAAPYGLPAPGADSGSFTGAQLAALGRAFSFNDPQSSDGAAGAPGDQNVELIVRDPRP